MIFDQIGGSFELAKQIGEIFINFFLGYVPRSAFYCILMVSYLKYSFFDRSSRSGYLSLSPKSYKKLTRALFLNLSAYPKIIRKEHTSA